MLLWQESKDIKKYQINPSYQRMRAREGKDHQEMAEMEEMAKVPHKHIQYFKAFHNQGTSHKLATKGKLR